MTIDIYIEEVVSLARQALAITEQMFGLQNLDTAIPLNNLAGLLYKKGDYEAAKPLLQRALKIREQVLDPQHPDTATSMNNLAALLNKSKGDYEAAEPLYLRDLKIREQVLGPQHPDTIATRNNLNILLKKMNVNNPTTYPSFDNPTSIKVNRNDPCPCNSGKRYKHCHGKVV